MGADLRSWDELDVLTRLLPNLDVTWITRVRLSEELPNPAHFVLGTDWNFSVGKNLVLRLRITMARIAQRRTRLDIGRSRCLQSRQYSATEDGRCPIGIAWAAGSIPSPPGRRGSTEIVPGSTIASTANVMWDLLFVEIQSQEVGLETGSRLGFTNSSANVLQLISKSQASDGSP